MQVFVTGATGLIGFAIVNELIAAGHQVTGLARSDASAGKLTGAGAKVLRGDIEDLDVLRAGAAAADGVIHTAFYHQISHLPLGTRLEVFLGGLPTGIVNRFMKAALDADRRALETMGGALREGNRPLVGTFATMALKPGIVATEDQAYDPSSAGAARGGTEATMHKLASQGVRTGIVRLPPIVHGEHDRNGFVPTLIKTARKKGQSAYLGNGTNRWGAVHKLDAARLFRLVLEKGSAGAAYHAVGEQGIPFREIAQAIGENLKLPAVSKVTADAAKQFSFLAPFALADNPVSSALTQQRMGWQPTQPGLFADLQQSGYFLS
ncbi:MAG: SDR family oxidoreductase [Acidobacteriota bacterium]|nr:SDR family oxidoreductase [Acidobacteriota bacterium]